MHAAGAEAVLTLGNEHRVVISACKRRRCCLGAALCLAPAHIPALLLPLCGPSTAQPMTLSLQQNRAADVEAKLMDDLTGASGELRSNVASDR